MLRNPSSWYFWSLETTRDTVSVSVSWWRSSIQAMRIFLTSMNRSLYDYFLFTLDLSFHECCYQNSILMHSCKNREQFYETSRKILEHYSAQLDTPERSCHVKRAKEYIENNLSEELSLPHVAAHIHISPGHLSELFTACTGKHSPPM